MKSLLLIAFLGIFLFNAIGYYFTFGLEDFDIKSRIMTLLENKSEQKNLEAVTISLSDFNSKIKTQQSFSEKEFVWNGNRYDLSSVTVSGNSVTINCYHDRDEEKLFSDLAKHFESSANQTSGPGDSKNIQKEPVKYVANDITPFLTIFNFSVSCLSCENILISEAIIAVPTPPPNA